MRSNGADACIIVTEWPEFAELDWQAAAERMAGEIVIDGRNFVDPASGSSGRVHLRGNRTLGGSLQALILAGGEGTRLRPLTSTIPKPVVPLVDRPFIAYMIEWLRGHGVDDVILACGFMAADVRAVLGDGDVARRAAPLRRGAAAAGHRRRAQVRGGPARRALPDAQRRRADRHRPERPARPARANRRARDARAGPGRGSVGVRARAPRRRSRRERVRREARPGRDRHQPDQRRRVRPRARRARRDGARGHQLLDRARRVSRGSSGAGCSATRRTATGSTSAPPSATCRRRSTSSRGPSRPSSRSGSWTVCCSRTDSWRAPCAPRRWSRAGCEVARGATIGSHAVLGPGVTVGEDARGRALGRARGRDRRGQDH